MIDQHHRFAKHKHRIRRYGDLIHDTRNLEQIDHDRHMEGRGEHYTEREFCRTMGIQECRYCENYLSPLHANRTAKSCTWYYGYEASECRYYRFDREKYESRNNN